MGKSSNFGLSTPYFIILKNKLNFYTHNTKLTYEYNINIWGNKSSVLWLKKFSRAVKRSLRQQNRQFTTANDNFKYSYSAPHCKAYNSYF